MNPAIPNASPADTLLGARPVNLPLPDGSMQQVHVRQPSLKTLAVFFANMGNPVALAQLSHGLNIFPLRVQ
jgi:hypothetical protein